MDSVCEIQQTLLFSALPFIKLEFIILDSLYEKHFKWYEWNYLLKLISHIKIELSEPFS